MYTGKIQYSHVIRNVLLAVVVTVILSACRFGEDVRPLVISGDFPLVYIKQPQNTLRNKVDENSANIGSDLYLRDISSPDSEEFNLTGILTNGKGAVSSPEVSFDGKQIVFSLFCGSDSSSNCNADKTWNIWTYNIETAQFQRVIGDFLTANLADDLDPVFLPDNRIVFSSTRQQAIREKYGYVYTDEITKKEASVLHVMSPDGSRIEQISFNRSSDFNPTILQNGKIMFSRREQVGEHVQLAIFTSNPDGSDMNVLYGAHSPGEAFVQPREMQNGKVISTVIPFEGTWGGGALLEIDSVNYSDATSPGPGAPNKAISGQTSATVQNIPLGKSISKLGRFTTPFPLLDGSDQVLVSFSFFQEQELDESTLVNQNPAVVKEAAPLYGIYMLDINDKSLKPLILSEKGFALTDAIALFPRNKVATVQRKNSEPGVFNGVEPEG
ncbi:MAG: hypothetical protein OEX07_11715, partial [Gammaproteobacteria bacterium]|nr:hypothetical protein [Gammaproteobacteria bacterium]